VVRPSAFVSVVRTVRVFEPKEEPETNSVRRILPQPEKLGSVIQASPSALVLSSANTVLLLSLSLRFPETVE